MNKVVLQWFGKVTSGRDFMEPVVEFGAFQVEGQEGFADLRRFFPGKEYMGCDLEKGPGVDRVESLEFSRFAPDSIGTVVCLDTLEHVRRPWEAASEIYRILKPGGKVLISIPFNFAVHCHPDDYWRMTTSGLEALLRSAGFSQVEVSDSGEDVEWDLFWDRPEERPEHPDFPVTDTRHFPFSCFAVASKPAREEVDAARRARQPAPGPSMPLLEVTPGEEFTGTVPVIMVLYHREEDTRKVLEQLDRVTEGYSLVLVDNGFDDPGYIESLGATHHVKNDGNVGISRAINQGLEVADGKYVAVIHNDLLIYDEGWLEHIVGFMERRPDVGMVGLAGRHTIREDGSLDEETLVISIPECEPTFSPSWRFTEVAAIDGICFVMRNIGLGHDESMGPLHYYDLDISMQYIEAGYRLYCAHVECRHLREAYLQAGGEIAALTSGIDTDEAFLEARQRFLDKWGGALPVTRGFVDEQYFYHRFDDLSERVKLVEQEFRQLEDHARKLDGYTRNLEAECRDKTAEIDRAKEYVSRVETEHATEAEAHRRYAAAHRELEERFVRLECEAGSRPAAGPPPTGSSNLEKLGFYLRTEGTGATVKRALRKVLRRGAAPGEGA